MTEINANSIYAQTVAASSSQKAQQTGSGDAVTFDVKEVLKKLKKGDETALTDLKNAGISYIKTTDADGNTTISFEYNSGEYEVTYIPAAGDTDDETKVGTNGDGEKKVITINEDNWDDLDVILAYVTSPDLEGFDLPEPGDIPTCGKCKKQNMGDPDYNTRKYIYNTYRNLRDDYMNLSDEDKQHALNSFKKAIETSKFFGSNESIMSNNDWSFNHSNLEHGLGDQYLDALSVIIREIRYVRSDGYTDGQTFQEQWNIYMEDYTGVPASVCSKYFDMSGSAYDLDNIEIEWYGGTNVNHPTFDLKKEWDGYAFRYQTPDGQLMDSCPYRSNNEPVLVLYKELGNNQLEATIVDKNGKEKTFTYNYTTYNALIAKGLDEAAISIYFERIENYDFSQHYDGSKTVNDMRANSPIVLRNDISFNGKKINTVEELIEALKSGVPETGVNTATNVTNEEVKQVTEQTTVIADDNNINDLKNNVQQTINDVAKDIPEEERVVTFPLPKTDTEICSDCGQESVKYGSSTWFVDNVQHELKEKLRNLCNANIVSRGTISNEIFDYIYNYAVNITTKELNEKNSQISVDEYIEKLTECVKELADKFNKNPKLLNYLRNKLSTNPQAMFEVMRSSGQASLTYLGLDINNFNIDNNGKVHLQDKKDDNNYQLLMHRLLSVIKAKYSGVLDDKILEKLLDKAQENALQKLSNLDNYSIIERDRFTFYTLNEEDLTYTITQGERAVPNAYVILQLIAKYMDNLVEEELFYNTKG